MCIPDKIILALALSLMAGLLYSAKNNSIRGNFITKTLLSALFIAAALSKPCLDPVYFGLVLTGLFLCLAGDVFLIFVHSRKLFAAGMISFIAGHAFYTLAFYNPAVPGVTGAAVMIIIALVSGAVFKWLDPHLGSMKVPVAIYIITISVMVLSASSLTGNMKLKFPGRALAFSGAVLFYISDFFVARQRFVKTQYLNRLIGLPLYYAGQFMIAFSVSQI